MSESVEKMDMGYRVEIEQQHMQNKQINNRQSLS